jgi:hypothetical protein
MSFLSKIKSIFGSKSDLKRFEALESDLKRSGEEIISGEPEKDFEAESVISHSGSTMQTFEEPKKLTLERDSVQLGLAAGYTGRSIRDIESSLSRIESQMVTKDWIMLKLSDMEDTMDKLSEKVDFISKFTNFDTIGGRRAAIEERLTYKMNELVAAVKGAGEISYDDLARRLNISTSALRGLLSNIMRRTDVLERFSVGNKGHVRYLGSDSSDLKRSMLAEDDDLKASFEAATVSMGYRVLERGSMDVDYLLEKEGKRIGAEVKPSVDSHSVDKAAGQLMMARAGKGLDELWLVVADRNMPKNLVETLKIMGIRVYFLDNGELREA